MSSEVRHLVDHGRTYPLVTLTGVLDERTAPVVRSVLLDLLAGQPEALVVDVGELDPGSTEAGAVLRDIHRDNAEWPATHLALCDPRPDGGPWQGVDWQVWPDAAGAFAGLGRPARTRRLSLDLEPRVGAARRTRELITESCDRWNLPDLSGPACIVATEMVNNVVAHARTPMVVLLAARTVGMSVAVRDGSATPPVFTGRPVSPTAHGGRGMLLIDSVAQRWGSLALDGGKVVWALLAPPSAPASDGSGWARTSMAGPARG